MLGGSAIATSPYFPLLFALAIVLLFEPLRSRFQAPIDRFFEGVTVNADEENKRAHRLDLLAAFRAAVHKVADFSRIEG